MKITHTDGKVTETDKLPDVDAMILEKSEEFRNLCLDTKRQFVLLVDYKGGENGKSLSFWNLKMKDTDTENPESMNKAYNNFFDIINNFISGFTKGYLFLGRRANNEKEN
jgi:hypothetical protein